MKITAIATSHDRRPTTIHALEALLAQDIPPGVAVHLVLVDDGSTDGTAAAVRELWPSADIIAGSGSLFWAAGMAIAELRAKESIPDFLLWLNDDVVLDRGALRVLLEVATQRARSGARACIVVGATRDPMLGRVTYSGLIRRGIHPMRFERVEPSGEVQSVETFNGNVALVPRSVYERVSIDGCFEHAIADLDYGLRARAVGCDVVLAPKTVGACARNSVCGTWRDSSLRFRERWRLAIDRRGIPPRSQARFLRRHAGPTWPVWWLGPYIKLALEAGLRRRTA